MKAQRGRKLEKWREKLLTCNKKQTCHVGGEGGDVSFAASTPQGGGGGVEGLWWGVGLGTSRHIIRNELRFGCKEGALDALRFYEAASRTERTVVRLALNSWMLLHNGITTNCHVPRTEAHFSTVKMSPNKCWECMPSRRQMSLERKFRGGRKSWWTSVRKKWLFWVWTLNLLTFWHFNPFLYYSSLHYKFITGIFCKREQVFFPLFIFVVTKITLCFLMCARLFCSILHEASYPSRSFSVAGCHAW